MSSIQDMRFGIAFGNVEDSGHYLTYEYAFLEEGYFHNINDLDLMVHNQSDGRFKFSDLQLLYIAAPENIHFAIEVVYPAIPAWPVRRICVYFDPAISFSLPSVGSHEQEVLSKSTLVRVILIEEADFMDAKLLYEGLVSEREEWKITLEEKQQELEQIQVSFDRLQASLKELQSSGSVTKTVLEERLQKISADAIVTGLNLKISQTQNTISSTFLKIQELQNSAEATERDQNLNSLNDEAQKYAGDASSLSPGSVTAKEAKKFADLVTARVEEARHQAKNVISAANETNRLLERVKEYVAEFNKLDLSSSSEAELTAKATEVDSTKAYVEQVLSTFTEIPSKSEVTTVKEEQVTPANLESVINAIKQHILNARFAADLLEQAKQAAVVANARARQQAEEAGKVFDRNSSALDKLFGLTTDVAVASPQDNSPSKGTIQDSNQLEKSIQQSIKKLFGLANRPQE